MGAVTSLLYGAEDPSIAGMVLDSSFSNLFDLMLELVDVYKIRLPKFTVKMAVQYMRRVIQKKAKFDIMDLDVLKFAPKSFIPALFGHASEDMFVQPRHSDRIYKSYAGDKNIIKFEGDHNSPRPQFYYDSVSIFFYNVLHPPPISAKPLNKVEKYYDLGDIRVGAGADEGLLYEIISDLRTAGKNASSSSSAPPSIPLSSASNVKSVVELLSESVSTMSLKDDVDFLLDEATKTDLDENASEYFPSQEKTHVQNEEHFSHSSSNRESWGRCSSLGAGSGTSSPADVPGISNWEEQDNSTHSEKSQSTKKNNPSRTFRALASPLRRIQGKSAAKLKEKKNGKPPSKKSVKRVKLEKGETLSQRLRLCFLKRVPQHKRHQSM
ncbi:uncharacterized protein LOC109842790 isoform X2 [Asparagus officinalis]|nr:uncharacterized protein LOC109842790 isoform X2 [Asparagus officinalis]